MKTKRIKKIAIASTIVAALAAAVIGILSAFGINLFSCSKNSDLGEAPESLNISAAPPTDGSLPTAHTGIENISYMVYVLANQNEWHSYSYTVSDAAGGINHQLTYTYKDYRDGALIASDMTSSSFVKSSTQTLYVGDDAYTRSGSEPKTEDINDITWDDGTPEYLQRQAYYEKYGLFANEISVFILNEESVSSCGEVTVNDDGTYTQSFTLDNDASTYYYKCNMKTRGGLSTYPDFTTVNITFTFNSSWEVLAISTTEIAAVKMGVISTNNTSVSNIEFTYGDGCVDETNYGFYESFFKQYVGNVAEGSVDSASELTITDALQYGFGEVLSGGKQYQIDLVAGENVYTGYVYASVDLNTLSTDTLNALDIRLSLGKTLDEQMLYIDFAGGEIGVYYSDSFAISANISELSLIVENFSSWLDTVNSSSSGGTTAVAMSLTADGTEEDSDVLTELLNLFEITETETGATIALDTEDLLNTGIGVSLVLEFEKNDETVLTFTGAQVNSIKYGGTEINVNVTLSDTDAEVITRNEEMTPASLADFAADIYDLLSSDLLDIKVTLDGDAANYSALDGLKVEATAQLTMESIVAGVDLYVEYAAYGGSVSARLSAYYDYNASQYGDIYLNLYEFDGKAVSVKLYCDVADLVETVELLLTKFVDGEQLDEAAAEASEGVAEIINSVLALDFSQVVTELYAYGTEIRLGVNLDEIMSLLGASGIPALGTAALVFDGESLDLSLAAIGLTIGVAGSTGAITEPSTDGYLDASKVLDDVYSLLSANSIALTISLDGSAEGCTVEALDGVKAMLAANLDADGLTLSTDITFSYTYKENVISASLALWYAYDSANYGTIYADLYKVCGKDVSVKLSCGVSDVLSLVSELAGEITLFADGGNSDTTAQIISALVNFDYSSAITTLATTEQGLTVGIDIDNILTQFGTASSTLGSVALNYAAGSAFTVKMPSVGVSASLTASGTKVTIPENCGEYLDAAQLVEEIIGVVGAGTIEASFTLDGSAEGCTVSYLDGITASGSVAYDTKNKIANVTVTAAYGTISATIAASYVYGDDYGDIYLILTEVCGVATEVAFSANVSELLDAVGEITNYANEISDMLGGDTFSDGADEIIAALLSMDYASILTDLYAGTSGGVKLAIDMDALLSAFGVSLGDNNKLGCAALTYNNKTLALAASGIGFTLSLGGSEKTLSVTQANYLDASDLVSYIASLVNSDAICIGIEIGGNSGAFLNGIISSEYLDGLAISGGIYITTEKFALLADLDVSYIYNGEKVSLGLQAYYGGDEISLLVDEIDGVATSIGVSCTLDTLTEALSSLIDLGGGDGDGAELVSNLLAALVGMDYSAVITQMTTAEGVLTIGADIGGLLDQLAEFEVLDEITLGEGKSFGTAVLAYNAAGKTLTLSASDLGVGATISGYSGTVAKADANYLSIDTLLDLVDSVKAQVKAIEDAQSVYFTVDCYATVLDLTVGIEGAGEVCWKTDSDMTVAIDLSLYIADGSSTSKSNSVDVKVLYSAKTEAFTVTVGGLGLTVTADDIDTFISGFNDLLEAICTLAGLDGDSLSMSNLVSNGADLDVTGALNDLLLNADISSIVTCLLDVISSDSGWITALNGMSLSVDSVSAALSGLGGYKLIFDANSGFSLKLVSGSESGNENSVTVTAGGKGLYSEIAAELADEENGYEILSIKEGDKLTEVVYNYALGLISEASIGNVLGTDTYEISFILDGDNTGVSSLKDVYVAATLYYTDSVTVGSGESKLESKLAEMDVSLKVNGVTVIFNIKYYDESLYVTLTNINNTVLNDLKLTIALGDVYAIADELVDVILNTNLTNYFASDSDGDDGGDGNGDSGDDDDTSAKLSEVLVKLLSLNFDSIITTSKVTTTDETGGTTTYSAYINIDELYYQFTGSESGSGLGTVTASITTTEDNGSITGRSIAVTGVYNNGTDDLTWLTVTLGSAARDYSSFKTDIESGNYWDLAFLQYLISDIVDFATDDNGDIYEIYTFSGNLTASVIGIDISISVLNLTVGLDSSNHLYVTLLGDIDKTTFLGMTITDDWLMGFNIAYSEAYGGYLVTCANNLGTDSAQYQVMTLNYLMDNLLKTNSCLKFMLGTGSTLWGMICSGLSAGSISLDSGISTPDELYLTTSGYTLNSVTSNGTSEFDISTIITGINAQIGGETYSSGTTNVSSTELASQISQIGGNDCDYYAIDFNNSSLASLTSNGITSLYAAILRDSDGLSGLVASGSIGGESIMTFTLNLEYNEGIDEEYDLTENSGETKYKEADPEESEFYVVASAESSDGYYVIDENGNYTYTNSYGEDDTLYVFSNDTYYIKSDSADENGNYTYTLAESYSSTATYYTAYFQNGEITEYYAPNLYEVVITNYKQELDYNRDYESVGSRNTFGCFQLTYDGSSWTGTYTDQTALYTYPVTVIYPDGTESKYTLKYSSDIYAVAADNKFANGDLYVYYIVNDDGTTTAMGSDYQITGETTIKVDLVTYQYTINGVIYTFDADSDGYVITGVAGGYSGSTLMLENEIANYPVTGIGYDAFVDACKSGGSLESVTTIIVPENITEIQGRAFHGCTGLQTVVFLADTINMYCDDDDYGSGSGEPQGFAFWGCSSSLTVYYTNVTAADHSYLAWDYTGTEWCWSYSAKSHVFWYTANCVNTVFSGWTCLGGEVTNCPDSEVKAIIDSILADSYGVGLTITEEELDALEAEIQYAVDAYMLEAYGYVGYYQVTLSAESVSSGKYTRITADVTTVDKYYLVTTSTDSGTISLTAGSTDLYYFDADNDGTNETYAKADAIITVSISGVDDNIYTFNGLTSEQVDLTKVSLDETSATYTFKMINEPVTVKADCAYTAVNVTVYSEVSFTYTLNGETYTYTADEENDYMSTITYAKGATLTTALTSADGYDGYYFLGWAQVVSGDLVFVSDIVVSDELEVYAIWTYTIAGTTYKIGDDNKTVTASNSSGSISAWYTSKTYKEAITSGTSGATVTISTANTVLVARWEFNLDFTFDEGNSKLLVDGSSKASSSDWLYYTYSQKVLEGYYVTVSYSSSTYGYYSQKYTIVTLTVYDSEGGSKIASLSHTMGLNKNSNTNGERLLSISECSENWGGTTKGSGLTSGTAYATINMYTYIEY